MGTGLENKLGSDVLQQHWILKPHLLFSVFSLSS